MDIFQAEPFFPEITGDTGLMLPTGQPNDPWKIDPDAAKGQYLYALLNRFLFCYAERSTDYRTAADKLLKPYHEVAHKLKNVVITCAKAASPTESASIETLMRDLLAAYEQLYSEFIEGKVSVNTVDKCVHEYFRLLGRSVYFLDNIKLFSCQFRQSEYIFHLQLPGYDSHMVDTNDASKGIKDSFADAFVLSALLESADKLANMIGVSQLTVSVILTQTENNLNRDICLHHTHYQIRLERQTGILAAKPLYERSDIEEVPPLQLLPTIRSFIEDTHRDVGKAAHAYTVSVLGNADEQNIIDLCDALRICLRGTSDSVKISYYVNRADMYTATGESRFSVDDSGNLIQKTVYKTDSVTCIMIPVVYESVFAFSQGYQTHIIQTSDITVFASTSYLFYPDYEESQEAPMSYYCNRFSQAVDGRLSFSVNQNTDTGSFSYLCQQLTRYAASRTYNVGVIRFYEFGYDNILTTLEKCGNKRKTVVFVAVNNIVRSFDPVQEDEYFCEKQLRFKHLFTYPIPSLLYRWNQSHKYCTTLSAEYTVSLWDFFSSLSLRLIREYRSSCINQLCLSDDTLPWSRWFELLNTSSINFVFNLINSGKNGTLKPTVAFDFGLNTTDEECEILSHLIAIAKDTIENVLFAFEYSQSSEDKNIRNSFASCLYRVANSIEDVFFIHQYDVANHLNRELFSPVSWKEPNFHQQPELYSVFKDKPVCQNYLPRMDSNGRFDLVALALMDRASRMPLFPGENKYDFRLDLAKPMYDLHQAIGMRGHIVSGLQKLMQNL